MSRCRLFILWSISTILWSRENTLWLNQCSLVWMFEFDYLIATAILIWSIAWAEAWLSWTAICIAIGSIFAILLISISSVVVSRFALTEVSFVEASASSIGITATLCSIIAGRFTLTRLFAVLTLWSWASVVTSTETIITTWSESPLLWSKQIDTNQSIVSHISIFIFRKYSLFSMYKPFPLLHCLLDSRRWCRSHWHCLRIYSYGDVLSVATNGIHVFYPQQMGCHEPLFNKQIKVN